MSFWFARPPVAALTKLVEFTFDHHHRHEEFIRMVMIENIHHGQYLDRSKAIRELNVTAIDNIGRIYKRGIASGVFRKGLDAIELHWQISALCFFNVSNRATFSRPSTRVIPRMVSADRTSPRLCTSWATS